MLETWNCNTVAFVNARFDVNDIKYIEVVQSRADLVDSTLPLLSSVLKLYDINFFDYVVSLPEGSGKTAAM